MLVLACVPFLIQRSVTASTCTQDDLTPQEKRGKQIYVIGGGSESNDILAYVGDSSIEVPGSALPCAGCHGLSGKGKPESGVIPSDLTWEALTKPYGVTHPNGRKHPPYTVRALELAITRGLDPAGNKLLAVMPRYQMSSTDLADLIAYLKRIGETKERGVADDAINIGVIVPAAGPLSSLGEAVKATTSALFAEVNKEGGIYNRKINLKFVETSESKEATAKNVRRFIEDQQIFAMASAFTAGAESEVSSLMNELQVPLVGPLTLKPEIGHPLNRYVFYLVSGLDDQARALVNYFARNSNDLKNGAVILLPEGGSFETVVNALVDQCRRVGCGSMEKASYVREPFDGAALALSISRLNRNAVFFLGSNSEALSLFKEAAKLQWVPTLYFPGGLGANDVYDAPPVFNNKLVISLPSSPSDQSAQAIQEFRGVAAQYNLPKNHVASQLMAYSAAKILVEGLKQSGKDLSAANLIAALERLNEFRTGLIPPVTYGPNRRLGSRGAYVVVVDLDKKTLVQAGSWIKVE